MPTFSVISGYAWYVLVYRHLYHSTKQQQKKEKGKRGKKKKKPSSIC